MNQKPPPLPPNLYPPPMGAGAPPPEAAPDAPPDAPQASARRQGGSFRLFRLWGVNVYLHWTWLLVAVFAVQLRRDVYSSPIWPIAEYLTLFAIVLMHEFGHALACRSVGGVAERIVLWPLGGVAFVNPPPRPGPLLWSIVAGPLVNVLLVPVTIILWIATQSTSGDLRQYVQMIALINGVLLVFNLLPIYPLDGGQILRSLLWFIIGRARSLLVAAIIGLVGAAAILVLALFIGDWWLTILAAFGALQSWRGLKQAQLLQRMLVGPRHIDFACPHCHQPPPIGAFWRCDHCQTDIDAFIHTSACPACGHPSDITPCPTCGVASPPWAWAPPVYPAHYSTGSGVWAPPPG
jgi:Zn-dependent protease